MDLTTRNAKLNRLPVPDARASKIGRQGVFKWGIGELGEVRNAGTFWYLSQLFSGCFLLSKIVGHSTVELIEGAGDFVIGIFVGAGHERQSRTYDSAIGSRIELELEAEQDHDGKQRLHPGISKAEGRGPLAFDFDGSLHLVEGVGSEVAVMTDGIDLKHPPVAANAMSAKIRRLVRRARPSGTHGP
jgi:hypothetical protein